MPPSLHFATPNPELDCDGSPFFVNAELRAVAGRGAPRRAGVSSFGIGGTNAHVVLEEAPGRPRRRGAAAAAAAAAAVGAHAAALTRRRRASADHLRGQPATRAGRRRRTPCSVGRRARSRTAGGRRAATATTRWPRSTAARPADRPPRRRRGAPVAFLFPGQGSQYAGMARASCTARAGVPGGRRRVRRPAAPAPRHDLRVLLCSARRPIPRRRERLARGPASPSRRCSPSSTRWPGCWQPGACDPRAMLGHSLGEYVAACLAGVFTLPDAVAAGGRPGRLVQATAARRDAQRRPGRGRRCGPAARDRRVWRWRGRQRARPVRGRRERRTRPSRLRASWPRDGVGGRAAAHLARLPLRAEWSRRCRGFAETPAVGVAAARRGCRSCPTSPGPGSPTGRPPTRSTGCGTCGSRCGSPTRWRRLCPAPGRGAGRGRPGPGAQPAGRGVPGRPGGSAVVSLLRVDPTDEDGDSRAVMTGLADLWRPAWRSTGPPVPGGDRRGRVPLPTYPFERRQPPAAAGVGVGRDGVGPPRPTAVVLGAGLAPVAARRAAGAGRDVHLAGVRGRPRAGWAARRRAARAGARVVTVRPHHEPDRPEPDVFLVDAARPDHARRLVEELRRDGLLPDQVVYAWSVRSTPPGADAVDRFRYAHDEFVGLVELVQALTDADPARPVRVDVLTDRLQEVAGDPVRAPERAMIAGAATVLPAGVLGADLPLGGRGGAGRPGRPARVDAAGGAARRRARAAAAGPGGGRLPGRRAGTGRSLPSTCPRRATVPAGGPAPDTWSPGRTARPA